MRPTRFYSNQQEKAVATALGGHKVANSGATPFYKGDVVTSQFLIECKTCVREQKTFSVQLDWLLKIREEMFETPGKSYSALAFNFGPNSENYYVIDEKLFKTLVSLLQRQEETDGD